MPGTMKSNQLTISAKLTKGANIPDKLSCTNVAGMAFIGNTAYCVKANAEKQSVILKTAYYKTGTSDAAAINKTPIAYYTYGMTTDGTYLYLLSTTNTTDGAACVVLKVNTAGGIVKTYNIGIPGYGIAYCGSSRFYVVYKESTNAKLKIQKVWLKTDGTVTLENYFYVLNSGYTERIQDIHYDEKYGLFILTNYTPFNQCKNMLLIVNTEISTDTPLGAATRINIDLDMAEYTQYNLKSVFLNDDTLYFASNVQLQSGGSEDTFAYAPGILFKDGTYSFNCAIAQKMKVPNHIMHGTSLQTTNFGAIAYCSSNGKMYGIKAGSNGTELYGSPSVCYANLFELVNYMDAANGYYDNIYDVEQGELGCLYHANGMDYYNNKFYVACGEKDLVGQYSFIKMDMSGMNPVRYKFDKKRSNAITWYEGNKFLVYSSTNPPTYDGKNYCNLYAGIFSDTTKTFNITETYYFANTGLPVIQDIFYRKNYGLFIVTCDASEIKTGTFAGEYQADKGMVLHIDLTRGKVVNIGGKSVELLTPDYAFKCARNESKFFSFELESVTVDDTKKQMVIAVNATNITPNSKGKHPGEDYVYTFSSIDFL